MDFFLLSSVNEYVNTSSYFNAVDGVAEKSEVFEGLVYEKGKILCQLSTKKILEFRPGMRSSHSLYVSMDGQQLPEKDAVIVYFTVEGNNYFLKTNLISKEQMTYIETDTKLYKLQRRKHPRIPIPESHRTRLYVEQVGNEDVSETLRVVDMSVGGLCLSADNQTINRMKLARDIRIEGFLKDELDFEFSFSGEIRHSLIKGRLDDVSRIGLQFLDLNSNDKTMLTQYVMDITRSLKEE